MISMMTCNSHSTKRKSSQGGEESILMTILMIFRLQARNSREGHKVPEQWEAKICRGTWRVTSKMIPLSSRPQKMKEKYPIATWKTLIKTNLDKLTRDTIVQWATQWLWVKRAREQLPW